LSSLARQSFYRLGWLFTCTAAGLTGAYIAFVDVPLFAAIRGSDYHELILQRQEAFTLLPSAVSYPLFLLKYVGFPLSIVFYSQMYKHSKDSECRTLLTWLIPLALFHSVLTTSKTAVVLVLFSFLVGAWEVMRWRYRLLILLGLPGAAIGMLYLVNSEREFLTGVLPGIVSRVLYAPCWLACQYLELMPEWVPFLNGASSGPGATLLGGSQVNLPNEIFLQLFPETLVESGSAPANGMVILYADFGVWGVWIGAVVWSLVLAVIDKAVSSERGLLADTFYIFLCVVVLWANLTSFTATLGSYGLLPAFTLYLVLKRVLRLQETTEIC
jgi:hypothetical protein